MVTRPVIQFDRVISKPLERALSVGGAFRTPLDYALSEGSGLDPQLRSSSDGASTLTLYAGLTKVLDLRERNGGFVLDVHPSHATAAGFDPTWRTSRDADGLAAVVPDVMAYLERVTASGVVDVRFSSREGRVQTLIGTARGQHFAAFQREAVPSFVSQPVKDALRAPFMERMIEALRLAPEREAWWPGVRDRGADPSLGPELDATALDSSGRLLTIEIKPADAVKGIAWAPGQARCYAELFALWLEVDPNARESIVRMSVQRRRLGLAAPPSEWDVPVQSEIRVVPVVAIGAGKLSSEALPRLSKVHQALQKWPSLSARLDPLEVWWVPDDGDSPVVWRPDIEVPPKWS